MRETASIVAPAAAEPSADAGGHPRQNWIEIWAALLALAAIGAAIVAFTRGAPPDGLYLPILALLVCFVAAWHDAATSRIPNALTYTAILVGLGLNMLAPLLHLLDAHVALQWLGASGALSALLGFALCAGIGIACLMLAGMGGGDMKLLAALGAMLGYERVLPVLFAALLIAVVYALVNLLIAGRLNAALRAVAVHLLTLLYQKRVEPVAAVSKRTIPLAVPLFIGLLVSRALPLERIFGI
jgi:prepilin peptidase CpaA